MENMGNTNKPTTYQGNPIDITSPAYGRVDALVKQYGDLMKSKISRLPGQKTHLEGPGKVLTPVNSFEEIGSGKVVLMAPQESVDAVVEEIIGQVKADVPEISQSQVIEKLHVLRPRYTPIELNSE